MAPSKSLFILGILGIGFAGMGLLAGIQPALLSFVAKLLQWIVGLIAQFVPWPVEEANVVRQFSAVLTEMGGWISASTLIFSSWLGLAALGALFRQRWGWLLYVLQPLVHLLAIGAAYLYFRNLMNEVVVPPTVATRVLPLPQAVAVTKDYLLGLIYWPALPTALWLAFVWGLLLRPKAIQWALGKKPVVTAPQVSPGASAPEGERTAQTTGTFQPPTGGPAPRATVPALVSSVPTSPPGPLPPPPKL